MRKRIPVRGALSVSAQLGVGLAPRLPIGGGVVPPPYTPALRFNDARNSQFIGSIIL